MLKDRHEEHQVWGGHTPILGALAGWLRETRPAPARVVECGCGRYSTPVLREAVLGGEQAPGELVSIEHDLEWAARMLEELGERPGHRWVIEPVDGIDIATGRREITGEIREDLRRRYAGYAAEIGRVDMVLVDTFTAARVDAVREIGRVAEVVCIHDTEADHPQGYGYGECEEFLSRLHRYSYRPIGATSEWHRWTWTEVFSRWPLPLEELSERASAAAVNLWGEHVWLAYLGVGKTRWAE